MSVPTRSDRTVGARSYPVSGGWRRLRYLQAGLVPRLQLAAKVIAASGRDRRRWRSLPSDVATALLAPIRVPGPAAPPVAARDWAPERAAAAARLRQAAGRWAGDARAASSIAAVAAGPDLVAWRRSSRVIELRPEDWVAVLEAAETAGSSVRALVVSTTAGNHGAWAFRLGLVAHPDAFLERDMAALVAWFAERGLASILSVVDGGADAVATWGSVARLFDLVLAPGETVAAGFSARPDRRGIEARVSHRPADLAEIRAAVAAVA